MICASPPQVQGMTPKEAGKDTDGLVYTLGQKFSDFFSVCKFFASYFHLNDQCDILLHFGVINLMPVKFWIVLCISHVSGNAQSQ